MEWTDVIIQILSSEAFLAALVTAVVAIIGSISKHIVVFIDTKTESLKKQTENELVHKLLDKASENARKVVITLDETLVKELRVATEDGKLSSEDILLIQEKAREMMMASLNTESVELLEKAVGDLDEYLTLLIESTLADVKKRK